MREGIGRLAVAVRVLSWVWLVGWFVFFVWLHFSEGKSVGAAEKLLFYSLMTVPGLIALGAV